MKMKTVERIRGLDSQCGDYEEESSSVILAMKCRGNNTEQNDDYGDGSIGASDEDEDEKEEEKEGWDGTGMFDAMNQILGKSLKGELNEKPVLALRKTKAMKDMDEVSENVGSGKSVVRVGSGYNYSEGRERERELGVGIVTSFPP